MHLILMRKSSGTLQRGKDAYRDSYGESHQPKQQTTSDYWIAATIILAIGQSHRAVDHIIQRGHYLVRYQISANGSDQFSQFLLIIRDSFEESLQFLPISRESIAFLYKQGNDRSVTSIGQLCPELEVYSSIRERNISRSTKNTYKKTYICFIQKGNHYYLKQTP